MKSTTNNKGVVIYARVSTPEQGEKKFSIDYQIEQSIKYAISKGLVKDYSEIKIVKETKPASTINIKGDEFNLEDSLKSRPRLQEIINIAYEKKFSDLIVYSRSRLTRNVEEFIALQILFKKLNIKLHFSKPGEEANSENNEINKFIDIILASIAELEANNISTRVKSGCRQCVKKGYWAGGKPPFGYKIVGNEDKNKWLEKYNSYRINKVKEIFNYYVYYGFGYRKIADIMNKTYPNDNWTKNNIEYILKNETYTGHICWDRRGGRRNPGKHNEYIKSPFSSELEVISSEIWEWASELRNKKAKVLDAKYYTTPYLLREKLVCGYCGKIMKTKNYGKNKNKVYKCPTSNNGISELLINKEEVEYKFINALKQIFYYNNLTSLWDKYKTLISDIKKQHTNALNDIKKHLNKINNLISKTEVLIKDVNIPNDMKQHLKIKLVKLRQEQFYYEKQQDKISSRKINEIESIDEFKKAIDNIFNQFSKYDNRSKRMFIDILVDKVIVRKNNGNIELEIIVNPPKNFN